MKRITTNDDIRFPISVVKGLDSDVFTILFYTTSRSVNITKTNADVEDGIIHLEWTELYPLGTGVMNYTVLIPEEDGFYSDDVFNSSISGTTVFYIVSNIVVPDGDDAQNLIEIVAQLNAQLEAEIARSTGKDSEHDTSLAGKANKNGSANEAFNTYTLNLRREGANTSLYNYNINGEEYVSFYDQTGGSLTYHFTPNQSDNIATERQLALKANSADVYTKTQIDSFLGGLDGTLEEPTEKIIKYSTSHPIRILGIGNSYMTEGTRELVGFLTAEGLTETELDLEIAYYPARTLEDWYEAIRDGGGYEQLVQFKYNSANQEWYRTAEHNVADIRDTISGKSWDLIILQEFPSFNSNAANASEYYSYATALQNTITLCKSLCPNASVEFGWHMIWSNDQYITNNYNVWQKIGDACMRTAKLTDVSFIIPSGTALQNAYNTTPFRGYEHHFLLMDQIGHPAAGAARYIISACWFESLIAPIFGRTLIGNGYVPSFVSDGTVTYQDAEVAITSGNVLLAKLCAISSILDKYDVNYELEKKLNLYYTKTQTDALLNNKADRTGSNQYNFTVKKLGLQNEGAAMVLYNYIFDNHDVIEFYDNEGGTLQYVFSGNNDKIATERQLAGKANTADVYTKGEVDTALSGKANTGDVYTKSEVNTKLAGKANTNGSNSQSFTANAFNLQKDGASTTLYNYKDANDREFVSFYDHTGGSLTYQFTANQGDNIATERQVNSVSSRVTTLENAGYLTSESDPTVPAWAKAENKPTYTASEVGALPDTTTIPSKVSDLTNDLGFVTGSKIYVGTCETAAATMPKVCTVETFPTDTNGKPLLGTVISVKFTATNTGTSNRGLNVNGTGSASVWYNTGVTTSNSYYGYAGRYITYMWDGTNWVFLTWGYDTNTTYTNVALGQGYAVQSNASASATITATLSSYTLTANGIVSVKFNYDVPANATLNINAKGAKAIYNKNAAITAGVIKAGDTATFIYNTYYRLIAVDSWQDNTGGGSGEDNVQSDWNETDTSSDAYILNKPTVDSSITGSSQTNAVQGGAIYTALSGKAGYKWYASKSDMEDDTSVTEGTVGYDSDEEKFYIYNSASDEWKPIDETDTQVTFLTITKSGSVYSVNYEDGTTLTPEQYIALLADHTKDIIAYYSSKMYFCSRRYTGEVEDGYVESTYYSFESMGNGVINSLQIDLEKYDDEPWEFYVTASDNAYNNTFYISSVNNTSQSVSYFLSGWTTRNGNILVVNFQKDVMASTTLNITSTGSKYIYYRGAIIKAGIISAGDTVTLAFWSNRYNVVSIDKYHATDIAAVNSFIGTASSATITKTLPYYSTWKVTFNSGASYSTWDTKIVLGTLGTNTAPVHTIIIEPQLLTGYTGDIVFDNQHIQWKDNDEPDLTEQGRSGFDYMVITIYEGEYAKYEKW